MYPKCQECVSILWWLFDNWVTNTRVMLPGCRLTVLDNGLKPDLVWILLPQRFLTGSLPFCSSLKLLFQQEIRLNQRAGKMPKYQQRDWCSFRWREATPSSHFSCKMFWDSQHVQRHCWTTLHFHKVWMLMSYLGSWRHPRSLQHPHRRHYLSIQCEISLVWAE